MPTSARLANFVETAFQQGALPQRLADRLYGGPSDGATCSICGDPIPKGGTEYELHYDGDGREFHVYVPCYVALELRVLHDGR
jgi:hypothetical protein